MLSRTWRLRPPRLPRAVVLLVRDARPVVDHVEAVAQRTDGDVTV
jgi:hypothetical protein